MDTNSKEEQQYFSGKENASEDYYDQTAGTKKLGQMIQNIKVVDNNELKKLPFDKYGSLKVSMPSSIGEFNNNGMLPNSQAFSGGETTPTAEAANLPSGVYMKKQRSIESSQEQRVHQQLQGLRTH